MYFKIVKKVGEAPTHFIQSVRSNELIQVHPWKHWETNQDGVEVNYFVYSRLHSHDLYVYVDREFATMYQDRFLADQLRNVINSEIASRFKMKWKHEFNLLDILSMLSTDPIHMSTSDRAKIGKLLIDEYHSRDKFIGRYEREMKFLLQHGLDFYQPFNGEFWLDLKRFGSRIVYTYVKYEETHTIADEDRIERIEEIFAKLASGDKNNRITDDEHAFIKGVIREDDKFVRKVTKSRITSTYQSKEYVDNMSKRMAEAEQYSATHPAIVQTETTMEVLRNGTSNQA